MLIRRLITRIVAVALMTSAIPVISFVEPAQASNPLCAPTYTQNPDQSWLRTYAFTTPGICDWVVPAATSVATILLVGAGGGGGGGSYGGGLGGGGGGGGGGAVSNFKNYSYFPAGAVVTIQVGAGGTGGAGASALNGSGSTGANGGSTKINEAEVSGGSGGGGGSIDVGGSGGDSGSTPSYLSRRGAGSFNGNGGGGASFSDNGRSATPTAAGSTQQGVLFDVNYFAPQATAYLGSGGSGGAAGSNTSQTGGTSSSTARTESYKGAGGGGGHGCPSTQNPCANRDGSTGRDGMVLISTLLQLVAGEKSAPNQLGLDFRFTVGTAYSFKPWFNPEPIGIGSWSITPAPPAGFSFNSTTGVLSGTPAAAANGVFYTYTYTDSLGSFSRSNTIYFIRAYQSLSLSNQNLAFGSTYRIPVEQLRGTGTLTIQTSNSNLCALSGSKNETITARTGSGSCTISISKTIDNSYFSYSGSFTINLIKATPTISIAANIASPQVTGTTIALTATTTGAVSGNVDFYIGDTLLTECGSNGRVGVVGSTATCNWTPTSAATDPFDISVRYVEAGNYFSSQSNSLSYQIKPDISLSYSNSESTFGNSATITPEVSGGTDAITSWTWTLGKTSDQQSVSGISINSSGVISVSPSLPSGTYPMTVTAQDTADVSRSTSLTIKVNAATPTILLSAPSKSAFAKGQLISLLATLPNDATGNVLFKYGTTTITACGASGSVSISSGSASCSFSSSSLTPGEYELSATYSGGGSYTSATSFSYRVTINPKSEFSYQSQSTVYNVATSLSPTISANTGTGISSSWSWGVVNASDSQTISGVTITNSGLVEVADTVGAGTYSLAISSVDLAGDTTTAQVELIIDKATPTITLSARLVSNTVVQEATAGRQIAWTIESTHRSSVPIKMFVDSSEISCGSPSIAWGNAQCWWSSSSPGTTVSAYSTFAGDSNLESATTNTISNFTINPSLSLSYSDTSTYVGIPTTLTPTFSGGSGRKTFTISQHFTGYQVPGITIDSSTGVIDVAASVMAGSYRMVLTITDEVYASQIDDNVAITVLEHSAPSISLSRTSESVETGSEIQGFALTNASTPGFLYLISPSLPTGFSFDPGSGLVSGSSTSVLSSRTFTITAINMAGSDTATYTLTVTEPTLATITLLIGSTPAAKGTPNTIVATISHPGRVEFLINGKRIPGCTPKLATTSLTCNWKPARIGAFAISAKLLPTSNAISSVTSASINVGVGRRTGLR